MNCKCAKERRGVDSLFSGEIEAMLFEYEAKNIARRIPLWSSIIRSKLGARSYPDFARHGKWIFFHEWNILSSVFAQPICMRPCEIHWWCVPPWPMRLWCLIHRFEWLNFNPNHRSMLSQVSARHSLRTDSILSYSRPCDSNYIFNFSAQGMSVKFVAKIISVWLASVTY